MANRLTGSTTPLVTVAENVTKNLVGGVAGHDDHGA